MKIVSNFEDYYDLHQGYNSTPNPSITYLRQTREADVFVKMKVEESLKKQIKTVKRFTSSSVTPEWEISFFLIGVGGQINKGVRITCGDEVEHSYTQTGAFFLPTKMGIDLSDEIKTNAYEHFCEFTFSDDTPFRLLNAPVFCVFSDDWNITRVVVNPVLEEFNYTKISMSNDVFHRIRLYIDNLLEKPHHEHKHKTAPAPALWWPWTWSKISA
jgi:hypothetical protein